MLIDLLDLRDWFLRYAHLTEILDPPPEHLLTIDYFLELFFLKYSLYFHFFPALEQHKQEASSKQLMAMQGFQERVQYPAKPLPLGQHPLITNTKEFQRVAYPPTHKVPHWRQIRDSPLSLVKDQHHPAPTFLDRSVVQYVKGIAKYIIFKNDLVEKDSNKYFFEKPL